MSRESGKWLNTNTLIGFTADEHGRGNAWHYRKELQGKESNHYPHAVPLADVKRRLFHWEPLALPMEVTIPETISESGVTPEMRIVDESRKVIVRPDTAEILGAFREGYEMHGYTEWLLNAVSTILGDTLVIGSAGLLMRGAVAWVSVEMPNTITTPDGIRFRPNLLACTSLNGKLATTYKRCVTNVVCDNTMDAALGESGQVYRVKHTRNSSVKLADAREALAMVHTIEEDFVASVEALMSQKVDKRTFGKFLDAWAPVPTGEAATKRALGITDRKREELSALWSADQRVEPWKRTAYGVMQAVNTWNQHNTQVKGSAGSSNAGAMRGERTMLNALNGTLEKESANTRELLASVLS